jgi:hypothetical protein
VLEEKAFWCNKKILEKIMFLLIVDYSKIISNLNFMKKLREDKQTKIESKTHNTST